MASAANMGARGDRGDDDNRAAEAENSAASLSSTLRTSAAGVIARFGPGFRPGGKPSGQVREEIRTQCTVEQSGGYFGCLLEPQDAGLSMELRARRIPA